jgi:hypothetical protein
MTSAKPAHGRSPAQKKVMTQCLVCKEDLPLGATICNACKNPQNWSRYLLRWKDIGTAFVGFVPLWTGAYALWNIAFREPAADLQIVAPVCERTRLLLAMANFGDATAILSPPRLSETRAGAATERTDLQFSPESKDDKYPYVLAPKKDLQIVLRPQISGTLDELPTINADSSGSCKIAIKIAFKGFKGREGAAETECACPQKPRT